jgi:hypothetical protein
LETKLLPQVTAPPPKPVLSLHVFGAQHSGPSSWHAVQLVLPGFVAKLLPQVTAEIPVSVVFPIEHVFARQQSAPLSAQSEHDVFPSL